jgi:hypothetical protein
LRISHARGILEIHHSSELQNLSIPMLSIVFRKKYSFSTYFTFQFELANIAINCYCLFVFRFLFDKSCPDYKYYEFQLAEEENDLSQSKEAEASKNGLFQKVSSIEHTLHISFETSA